MVLLILPVANLFDCSGQENAATFIKCKGTIMKNRGIAKGSLYGKAIIKFVSKSEVGYYQFNFYY
jgi:hypothetical protein